MKKETHVFKPIVARAAGFYDPDEASASVVLDCKDPSLTVQASKEEADINTIVRRFNITGEIPINARPPFPGDTDFDDIVDFKSAQDAMLAAKAAFMALPAKVRSTFDNDPVAFADFAIAPENLDQLRGWGLAPPAPEKPA